MFKIFKQIRILHLLAKSADETLNIEPHGDDINQIGHNPVLGRLSLRSAA